jgi:excisionase family DNA binding protein
MTNSDALARQVVLQSLEGLLTVQQSAEVLGCSDATIRNWIREGRLRAYRVGPRFLRIKLNDLEKTVRSYSKSKYN